MQNVSRSNVAASCALSPSSVQRNSATSHRTQKRLAANNGSVSRLPRLVGSYLITPTESRPDETELFNFLRNHHIVVPSTPGRPPRPTVLNFEQGESRTQVDYIMTREATAGRSAKRSSPLPRFFQELENRGPSAGDGTGAADATLATSGTTLQALIP